MDRRKVDFVAIGVMVLLLVTAYFTLFRAERDRVAQLREKKKFLSEKLQQAGEMDLAMDRIHDEIVEIRRNLADFDRRLPEEKRIYDFLRSIDGLAAKSHVTMESLVPGPLEKRSLYSRMEVKIAARGRFPDFYRFLSRLEGLPRITHLTGLRIKGVDPRGARDGATERLCAVEMDLAVFVSGG